MEIKKKPKTSSDNFAPRIVTVSAADIYEGFDISRDTQEIFFGGGFFVFFFHNT